jgi:transcriptional regulator of arginine metabolism
MIAAGSKSQRQAAILRLLREIPVETQEQLTHLLHERHLEADQATISRDLRELEVVRVAGPGGRRYLPPTQSSEPWKRAVQVLSTQLERLERVGLMVVLHTPVGAAPVVAAAVDALQLPDIAGTVAGDDTIFIQARSGAAARRVTQELESLRHLPLESERAAEL